jgi:hypothetical protein
MAEELIEPMEYIWERVPKTKEGLIHYLPGDIPYLFANGFVDTTNFTYEQWKNAFEDCRQDDGSYLVSREKFMSLRKYRYEGPVFEPFDPHKVREGEWTDEDLQKLYDLSIQPSSGITREIYWNSINALKDQGLEKNGRLIVNESVKKQLAYLIERFPSPRRRLEQEVHRLRQERENKYREVNKNRESSKFVSGKLASEEKISDFKNLQTKQKPSKKSPKKSAGTLKKDEGLSIKKLRKPSRKIGV